MAKSKKPKKWLKFRHRIVRSLLNVTLGVFARLRYRIKIQRFKEQEKRPYLILLNHQTAFDQFFVGIAFKGPVYYMASEDIFSMGFASSLIKYLVAPIPIKKQTTDLKAIKTCIRVAREGGTIAIAPEGNRTYSGRTEYMSPSIAPLARKLGMPIALYRLEGGYGVHPRWSDAVRKGRMRGYVSRVISPEEYAAMSDGELFDAIQKELYVDEAVADAIFTHKKLAEYLERAMYVCPYCGLSSLESHDDEITCLRCGRKVRYLPTKELEGIGFEFPFRFVADWYDYQKKYVARLDLAPFTETAMYTERANLFEVIPYEKKKRVACDVKVSLFGDKLCLETETEKRTLLFDEITAVTVLGRNKCNVYHDGRIWQLKGSKRFNALKYVHIYHRYQNTKKGDGHGEFLGL